MLRGIQWWLPAGEILQTDSVVMEKLCGNDPGISVYLWDICMY